MAGYCKRLKNAYGGIDRGAMVSIDQAVAMVKERAVAKFDETIDVVFRCNIDTKKSDQVLRSIVSLPEGTGKVVRVAVFAKDAAAETAKKAGADIVGAEDLVERIQRGEMDFDSCIATPDMMALVGRLGKVLGPRGLMPNPKLGTVTADVEKAVKAVKGGQISFRADKSGIVHSVIGKASFSAEALLNNFRALYGALIEAKPASVKNDLVSRVFVSSTMGVSVRVDVSSIKFS
ncbi:50S ribosomal protein L1 [Candidatus Hydrogenosomobacter endosymbioticus]|uniref:Large ribosomal subunit protein uL1 n=1 Tax=Candidatus Hydrogenosomobacter endosymbioticus TaxID=2558174 RepID=A0ABM7V9S6_9PROT|nr:50S ribosomal protein L1 [Candidatus Hydrogenosomobacter endosymbioticus]BDB96547.1 50S ribosomal protein L1 [Candidatus Hydrogenosomobacter endosymbioticus]